MPSQTASSRARPDTNVGSSSHGQQQSGTESNGSILFQHVEQRNPNSNRSDIKAERGQDVSPQRAQLDSTSPVTRSSPSTTVRAETKGPGTQALFSRTVQPETERASVIHLRRNAMSAGMPCEDYRYRSGQPTQRELTETLLGHVEADIGRFRRSPSPADSFASDKAVCDSDDDGGGDGWHDSSSAVGKHPRSSDSAGIFTKRQER